MEQESATVIIELSSEEKLVFTRRLNQYIGQPQKEKSKNCKKPRL